ncbi:hypothetical protein AL035_13805 [Salipiger aestuarii]|nr:hypothetical protein AL035_13805 [Salipiger aestuarii]
MHDRHAVARPGADHERTNRRHAREILVEMVVLIQRPDLGLVADDVVHFIGDQAQEIVAVTFDAKGI